MDNLSFTTKQGKRYTFEINPSSASIGYKLKVTSDKTYGGKVVQILNSSIDTITISGQITQKNKNTREWGGTDCLIRNMEEFEDNITALMEYQVDTKDSVRLSFPALGWDANVFITSYGDVKYDTVCGVATYTIRMSVDTASAGLMEYARYAELDFDAIPDGVGWTYSIYNSPTIGWDEVKGAMEKVLENAGTADEYASFFEALDAYLEENTEEQKKIREGITTVVGEKAQDAWGYTDEDVASTSVFSGRNGTIAKLFSDAEVNAALASMAAAKA